MVQLIQLRWMAVVGQISTIVFVVLVMGIPLPVADMAWVFLALIALNLFSMFRPRSEAGVRNGELLGALLIDVAALTALLYLSGGATNPFVFLYLLQVALGAVLLEAWSTWVLVAVTSCCFLVLTRWFEPLVIPGANADTLFRLHIIGMLICFVLNAVLVVVFVTRINRNLRRRDERVAELRQNAVEQDHIVRMGLLASGAAHELGTPLASLSVILGDWKHMPVFRADPALAEEIQDMESEVLRCKNIVTGILMSAGEARGERAEMTSLHRFLNELASEWVESRAVTKFHFELPEDEESAHRLSTVIVSDSALKQVLFNVLDNALEASPHWVSLEAKFVGESLEIQVRDRGPGFAPEILAAVGRPYQSTKGRPGGGLGLFLVFNVVRKLGGKVRVENAASGVGAIVTLSWPLHALALDDSEQTDD